MSGDERLVEELEEFRVFRVMMKRQGQGRKEKEIKVRVTVMERVKLVSPYVSSDAA